MYKFPYPPADQSTRLRIQWRLFVLVLAFSNPAYSDLALPAEPDERTYNFVSHYRVSISAPADVVWKHLIDLGSWMHEFEMKHISGAPGKEGEVLQLYAEQDFFVQITKAVPNELLVMVNLPSTFKGEFSTGVGVITLQETDEQTNVDLTMTRRYTWEETGENPMKQIRESAEFIENTDTLWQGSFLQRLRFLAEASR